jgi:hypothetical protein
LQLLVLAVQVVVLCHQMLLYLERLVKHRLGIVVGLLGALVCRRAKDLLPYGQHGQSPQWDQVGQEYEEDEGVAIKCDFFVFRAATCG